MDILLLFSWLTFENIKVQNPGTFKLADFWNSLAMMSSGGAELPEFCESHALASWYHWAGHLLNKFSLDILVLLSWQILKKLGSHALLPLSPEFWKS